MKPGSVIVDMAASNGGNVEGAVADELVLTENRSGSSATPTCPAGFHLASQLYGTNLVNLLKLLTPGKDGQAVVDFDDVVQRGMTVCRGGVHVAAATRAGQRGACGDGRGRGSQEPRPAKARDPRRKYLAMALAAALFALVAVSSPPVFLGHFTVFALAVIVGFYVISNVAHALHTPLMSETNAISGIILVGALLQIGSEDPLVRTLAFVATVIASVNIFGGFAVTGRMLQMFRKD